MLFLARLLLRSAGRGLSMYNRKNQITSLT